ncbi:hypothetical protein B0H17DRAFT_1326736 [Mycena rosella]|uniref:F-box domain-containing protein n=1 Tax=Mycena rosella TaxID=1033263 RepID=A0AAD7GS42_MYCRO|nr:hypothetical protein B0H17DRAFT_1326736 [Mycena rosella]
MRNFPQELIDRILDDLHDDEPSLVQCSLVCRAWLPTTRYHLFSDLMLERQPSKDTALLELLALGPCTFTPFITHVWMSDRSSDAREVVEAWAPRLPLLCQLSGVTTIYLTGSQFFPTLAHLTGLTYLRLHGVKFDSPRQLFDMLESCPTLTSLGFYDVECTPSSESVSYSESRHIRDLDIGLSSDVLDFFAGRLVAPHLNCNKIGFASIRFEDTQSIGKLLRHVGENLHDLSLGFANDGLARVEEAFCAHVDLRHNTQLRTLRVTYIIQCTYDGTSVFCMETLPQILRTIASPHISGITLLLYIDQVQHLKDFAWAALDDSLSAPNLASLAEIKFWIRGEMREDHLTAEAAIRLEMPQCCAKRNMTFLDCW